jgi:hypothetical protein
MLRRALLLLGLAALVAAGCGGGGSRLSKDEYATKANAVCADFNAKVKGAGSPGTSLKSLAAYADKVIPIFEDGLGELKKLKPPKNEQNVVDDWLKAGDEQLGLIRQIRDAARENNQAEVQRLGVLAEANDRTSDQLAEALGATTCTQDA